MVGPGEQSRARKFEMVTEDSRAEGTGILLPSQWAIEDSGVE